MANALVPDHLLVPVLEVAADTLRGLDSNEVPQLLRHLHGFDRRGLMHGPGPRQLRKAVSDADEFAAKVRTAFAALPAVEAVLAQWSDADPVALVDDAARRNDLPLLASVLWTCEPEGAEFGLGLLVERAAQERRERGDEMAVQARAREAEGHAEARRRADAARMAAEAEVTRMTESLRDERTARREREEKAEAATVSAQRQTEAVAAELAAARAETDAERERTRREVARSRALETDLTRTRADLAAALARIDNVQSRLDPRDTTTLADAAAAAHQVAVSLEALRRRVRGDVSATTPDAPAALPRERPLARRVAPNVPAGLVAHSAVGIEAMLRTPDALLVVDGYNVSKRAWPDATASDQRERLAIAVTGLHRRVGSNVLLVFDGDGTSQVPALRRGGVRVVFSDAGEEADEVVVREVAAIPKRVPVVVASSDAWVRQHAEAEGAVVVGADDLLTLLRPAR